MKKFLSIAALLFVLLFAACTNSNGESDKKDSTSAEPPAGPAPDNSNATNPSIPDTATITDSAH